jgi:nucleotide-binding universal stress UspA family protein
VINRILVPIDGSDHSARAAQFAADLAAKLGGSITFLHVLTRVLAREPLKRYKDHLEAAPDPDLIEIESVEKVLAKSGEREAIELLDRMSATARAAGVTDVDTSLVDGDPAGVVVNTASRGGYDLLVVGRRGMGGLKTLLMGSVSQKVASSAPCTVVMVN